MSTAARELEELRKAREAERLRKEEEKKIQDEKDAAAAKKAAFLARGNAFSGKKGPTEEEVKAKVTKESAQRKFGRQLNNLLKNEPGKNAFALELGLKGKTSNDDYGHAVKSDVWELVHQDNDRPYYWNKITNEVTYDPPADLNNPGNSFVPPPPPPRQLPGMMQPPPPTKPKSPWTFVWENEATPYYWNTVTNETTFDRPEAYIDEPTVPEHLRGYSHNPNNVVAEPLEGGDGGMDLLKMWQETEDTESGETFYLNVGTGEHRTEQPVGTVLLITMNEAGDEVSWQVCVYGEQEDNNDQSRFGAIYYLNLATGETTEDRPEGGTVMIVEK